MQVDNDRIAGFSSEEALLEWAAKKGKRKAYENCLKGVEKARKQHDQLSEKELADYEKNLKVKIKALTTQFNAVLKKEGVAKYDAEKILKLAKAGKLGTGYLDTRYRCRGRVLAIPNNYSIGRLAEYNFNNTATSAINASNDILVLHEGNWYIGRHYFMIEPWTYWNYLWWLNNKASSVTWAEP